MISFIKQPNKYTPVNNPIIFQIQSDDPTIQFFKVTVADDLGNIIANLRLFTTPDYRSGSFTDLSTILSNTVTYQLLPSANLIDFPSQIIQAYQLSITEKVVSGGVIVDGVTLATGIFYAWNGELDKLQFTNFSYPQYVVTTGATLSSFLTNKPDYSYLNQISNEYLSFLNDGAAHSVLIKTYNNGLLNSYNPVITGSSTSCRIDVSPTSLAAQLGVNFAGVDYFTVQVLDNAGNAKTVTKGYKYRSLCSYQDPLEVLFLNRAGGFDSFTFFNVRETVAITKTNITKNPFAVNSNGDYTDTNNGVYNTDTETININSVSTYKAITEPLTDAQSFWLKELVQSSKVFVKLSNGTFLPVQLNSNNYPVQQRKYTTALMRLEIEFVANGDVVYSDYDFMDSGFNHFNETFSDIFY